MNTRAAPALPPVPEIEALVERLRSRANVEHFHPAQSTDYQAAAALQSQAAECARLREENGGWQPLERDTAPPEEAQGKQVLLWKAGTYYAAKWVHSEVMGPVWGTPDGHVIFGATHWRRLFDPPHEALSQEPTP